MRAAGGAGAPAPRCAQAILDAFDDYQHRFLVITRRAQSRFERRDWHGMQADAVERLDLYGHVIAGIVAELGAVLGDRVQDRPLWAQMKAAYSWRIRDRAHLELAETFFNSVTRRIFATVGVDPAIEFLGSDFDAPPPGLEDPVYTIYRAEAPLDTLFHRILEDLPFTAPLADPGGDARRLAAAVVASRPRGAAAPALESVDVLDSLFYRGKGAYLVARIRRPEGVQPLVVALLHEDGGIRADAVLLTQDEASIVFSFARSYFHVDVANPRETIAFLKTIMPLKPVAELYIALGYNKHGKTELYRDLLRHLQRTPDRFEIARGDPGMVMVVFTMPGFDVVFKVIRDEIVYPKTTTRAEVMEKYRFVFRHDRAGRLVDAQEFENLSFAADRFSRELLEELRRAAPETVTIADGLVHFRHLYVERRLTPLNLYLREADAAAAREAVVDYGQAVRDMAATNVFPGDLLLKNFGVSRHGRVIFYDYDELCPVTDCNFRDLPPAGDAEEALGAEPWFYVGRSDIFPEEFLTFLGLRDELREVFLRHHGDLLGADYWRRMQARHRAGEVLDIFPYRQSRRLERGRA